MLDSFKVYEPVRWAAIKACHSTSFEFQHWAKYDDGLIYTSLWDRRNKCEIPIRVFVSGTESQDDLFQKILTVMDQRIRECSLL